MAIPGMMPWRRALLIAFLLLPTAGAAANDGLVLRHLVLAPGETTAVSYPEGSDLLLSRRGIVDVFTSGAGQWQLTALRVGLVTVEARDQASNESRPPRLLIEVRGNGTDHRLTSEVSAGAPPAPPQWLCQMTGVQCGGHGLPPEMIRGEVSNLEDFRLAKQACDHAPACLFGLELAATAAHTWCATLRERLGRDFLVRCESHHAPTIETLCGDTPAERGRIRTAVDQQSQLALGTGLVQLTCLEDQPRGRYAIDVRVSALTRAAARELGIDTRATGGWNWPAGGKATAMAAASGLLRALEKDHEAEAVAAPSLDISAFEAVELATGGEFQVIEHVVRSERPDDLQASRASWKSHGLELSLRLRPLPGDRVTLAYALTYRSPPASGMTTLGASRLKGQVELTLGAMGLAGIVDLKEQQSDRGGLPLLAQLPLIGPLFGHATTGHSHSHLGLWFTARRLGQGPPGS